MTNRYDLAFSNRPFIRKSLMVREMRRGSESNRRIQLLQSRALPLGYPAVVRRLPIHIHRGDDNRYLSPGGSSFGLVERLDEVVLKRDAERAAWDFDIDRGRGIAAD